MSHIEANKLHEPRLLRAGFRAWRRKLHESKAAHATIPLDFLPFVRADALTPCALRVYLHLMLHANRVGESWHTVGEIAHELGMSDRNVQRGLKQLERSGLIARVRFPNHRTRSFLLPFGSYVPSTGHANGETTEGADA